MKASNMKPIRLLILCFAFVTVMQVGLHSKEPVKDSKQKAPVTPLMHLKLEKSKAILEGLTLDDHVKVAKHAKELKLLSLESGWKVVQTAEYATQSKDFRRACDMIAEAAADKDISRATLGYVALTVRCVECHAYMRKAQIELTKVEFPVRGPQTSHTALESK